MTPLVEYQIDLVSAVEELSRFGSKELGEMLKDTDNFVFQSKKENGAIKQVDMEKLVTSIPIHLLAVCLSTDEDIDIAYMLRGIRFLHTLAELASRHARLEQVLLDDVRVSEQVIDLVFFLLTVLSHRRKENHHGSHPFLHSAIVACSLHLLTAYISSQWHEIAQVLIAHPKVDIFVDVAFCSLREDVRLLDTRLSTLTHEHVCDDSILPSVLKSAHYLCQQCEASLQYLLPLCQQKPFQDRILNNEDLSKTLSILSLTQAILRLKVPTSLGGTAIAATISRMKSKILSTLLHFCEAEHVSYLDMVASSPRSMRIAQFIATEVISILMATFQSEQEPRVDYQERTTCPMGPVVVNALRLVDAFSDDSNFRYSFMTTTIPFLTQILSSRHEEFVSSWCSVNIQSVEEDANLDYDPFAAADVALFSAAKGCSDENSSFFLPPEINYNCPHRLCSMSSMSYAQTRTSYLIKIVANLDVFVDTICKEQEKDLFVQNFHNYLLEEKPPVSSKYPSSAKLRAAAVCKNLNSLSFYATSLIPLLLNEEDVILLRTFSQKLEASFQSLAGFNIKEIIDEPPVEKLAQSCPVQPVPSQTCVVDPVVNNNLKDNKQSIDMVQPLAKQEERPKEDKQDKPSDDSNPNGGLSRSTLRQNLAQLNVTRTPKTELYNELNHPNIIIMGLKACRMDADPAPSSAGNSKPPDCPPNITGAVKPLEPQQESASHDDVNGDNEAAGGEERQPKRRKRTIMNHQQVSNIEKALAEHPDMHRSSSLLQSYSEKISSMGPAITPTQLKNWLNNRKAKLARVAKEARNPQDGASRDTPDRGSGPTTPQFSGSPESGGDETYVPPSRVAKTSGDETYVPPPTRAKAVVDEAPAAPPLMRAKGTVEETPAMLPQARPKGTVEETPALPPQTTPKGTVEETSAVPTPPAMPPPVRAKGTVQETHSAPSSGKEVFATPAPIARTVKLPDAPKSSSSIAGGSNEIANIMQGMPLNRPPVRSPIFEPGRLVLLIDHDGKLVGKGRVHQVDGRVNGTNLVANQMCVVDVTELKVERSKVVPHPLESGAITFAEAAARHGGVMRVAWDINKAIVLAE